MTIISGLNNIANGQAEDASTIQYNFAQIAAQVNANAVPTTNSIVPIANVAVLRSTQPLFVGQQFNLLGYTVAGKGGGILYYTGTVSDTSSDNSVTVFVSTVAGIYYQFTRPVNLPVDVTMAGAVGDGSVDDTAAIQKAINYCTNLNNRIQRLYFPSSGSGYYKVTSTLTITGRLTIVGDGEFSTLIFAVGFSSGQYVIDYNDLAASVVYFSGIENLTIRSNNSLAVGIRINNLSYVVFKRVQLYALLKGIYITGTGTFSNFFEEVTGYQIVQYTVQMDSFTGGGQYLFLGCTFSGSDGFVLSSNSTTDGLGFYTCNFEQCTTDDIFINGNVRGLAIVGCRSEAQAGANCIFINPAPANSVTGIHISGNNFSCNNSNAYPITFGGSGGVVKGFSITGNQVVNGGNLAFLRLNGAGDGGVLSGNYSANTPTAKIIDTPRAGVCAFSNQNLTGAMTEYGSNVGTFTVTGTGFTVAPTSTASYSKSGNTVTLDISILSGTSNATTFTATGLPSALNPLADKDFYTKIADNGTSAIGLLRVKTTGVIEIYASINNAAFTAAGTKSLGSCSVSYTVN